MREHLAALINKFLFLFGILKGGQVLVAPVSLAVDPDDIGIRIGNDQGRYGDGQDHQQENDDGADRQRILHELAHTVLEKGGGFTHDIGLPFLFIRSRFKQCRIDLQA